ncbi:metallo-beta-lactamase family protein [Singulisphaera sp. GP187]|uniref:MBL fold metallo-hydrolase n=1 Tax=Singulisphaera sp. GP187 TaxID=1882752 RepID=UPI00092594DD|nr:MBL fold metallo-hydrolase [Singulisphaera sp. GP187]SIO65686.1 metallo-beta-lactamase family protein [Singulisphaera sp. GP187]
MRITFHGAARQVTGTAHLLEIGSHKILLDCGLFDSNRIDLDSPNRQFSFDPRDLDAVIVSHAHNDHIGRLPCLVRAGYHGPIITTPATGDILSVMLRDSARIQREDLRNANSRNPHAEPIEPLFELVDVELVVDRLERLPYAAPTEILPGVVLTYFDAGHILGSAMIQLDYEEAGRKRRFLFTGDLGRRQMGLLPDPTIVKDIDILVSESTYGNRELEPYDKLIKQLHAIVARATRLQSKIVIPAFSLGRTQRMIYCLQELFAIHKVRPIPIYVDSPLAMRLTDIHRDHPDAYTPAARQMMDKDPMYFGSKYVEFCASWDDSRRLNYLPGPLVIISSSGMCEAGRIRHHLRHIVDDPDNAIVIVSYQAEGTLGRRLAEGVERIQIMDQWHELNAAVYVLDGFSGHADRNDLAWWFEQTGGRIERGFLVHGEPEGLEALAPVLQPHLLNPVEIPDRLATYEV